MFTKKKFNSESHSKQVEKISWSISVVFRWKHWLLSHWQDFRVWWTEGGKERVVAEEVALLLKGSCS